MGVTVEKTEIKVPTEEELLERLRAQIWNALDRWELENAARFASLYSRIKGKAAQS